MANPSMDRDLVSWLPPAAAGGAPGLAPEMLATMVQELMGAEAQQLCGASTASARASGALPQRLRERETLEPAPSSWPFPSCAEAATPGLLLEPRRRRSGRW